MSGLAGLSRGTRVPICPALLVSRGTGTVTEVCGTSGTGTNFRGTVPHGCPAGQVGSGHKIAGLSRPVPCPSLTDTVPKI